MKKLSFLFLLGFLASSYSATAQLSINPNPVYVEDISAFDVEGVGHSLVSNETNNTLNLTWERTVIEMTEGWTSAVCDVNQCYLVHVSSQPFILDAGQDGTMDVHVYPNGIEGAAIIEIEVYETDNPSVTTTGTYFFNQTSGVAEKFSEAISVYPNPTQDFISIDNDDNTVKSADLYDVKGKLVLSSTVNGNQKLSIQELPSGNYILKMMDEAGNIVSTNHVVKN